MEATQTVSLISGVFTPNEAKEILLEMIKAKINFHNIRNLTSEVRYNHPDYKSKQRIEELTEARENLLELINDAKLFSKNIRIETDLFIQLTED